MSPLPCNKRFHDIRRIKHIRVSADERLVHQVLGIHQRGHDVVVFPIVVLAKSELGIIATDFVDLITADETNVFDAISGETPRAPNRAVACL